MRTYTGLMLIEAVAVLLVVFGIFHTTRKHPKVSGTVFLSGCLIAIVLAGGSIALTV